MKYLIILAAVSFLAVPSDGKTVEGDTTLIDFKIKDQFDNEYRRDDFRDTVLVFLAYDRKGNDFKDQWMAVLRDSLSGISDSADVEIIRLANVRGVPFFLKGMLKGKFPREKDEWVLLDWKGRFDKAYEFTDDVCNILVFDRRRRLSYRIAATEPDAEKVNQLLAGIRSLLYEK